MAVWLCAEVKHWWQDDAASRAISKGETSCKQEGTELALTCLSVTKQLCPLARLTGTLLRDTPPFASGALVSQVFLAQPWTVQLKCLVAGLRIQI